MPPLSICIVRTVYYSVHIQKVNLNLLYHYLVKCTRSKKIQAKKKSVAVCRHILVRHWLKAHVQ